MNSIMNTYHEPSVAMLFALLRSSFHNTPCEVSYFKETGNEDWQKCYRMAVEQGVMSIAWDGVKTLPAELQPAMELKLSWAFSVQRQEQVYEQYCATASQLTSLFKGKDIDTIVLKGIGLSTYYQVPSHRECGDIDIYTCASEGKSTPGNDVSKSVNAVLEGLNIEADKSNQKHDVFYFHGIPVENHNTFLEVRKLESAEEIERILHECLNPQTKQVTDDKLEIMIPSDKFNLIFVAYHALQHLYYRKFNIHHLMDFAYLIQQYGKDISEEIQDKRFRRFVSSLILLCNNCLGLEIKMVSKGSKQSDVLFKEITNPPYTYSEEEKENSLRKKIIYKYYTSTLRNYVTPESTAKSFLASMVRYVSNLFAIK